MLPVNEETIEQFSPTYLGYAERRKKTAALIGVESTKSYKDFRQAIDTWNRESKIGWSVEEQDMLSLILSEEAANARFHGNKFIRPEFGGNTAEHPIFAGQKIDAQRDAAGYGPSHFADLDLAHQLACAKICQEQHALIAVHDMGELIDITAHEMRETGASSKEPPEEKEVGPFKIRLAAFALSKGNPTLYSATMHEARERIKKTKAELLAKAHAHEITGDEFVIGVGHEIGNIIREVNAALASTHGSLEDSFTPEVAAAAGSLTDLFARTQEPQGFSGALHTLFDKLEGDAHYRHFMGRMKTQPTAETPLYERMFQNGDALSFHLASSYEVVSAITYAQKTIPYLFEEVKHMPRGIEKDIATGLARASSAALLRNHIRELQKSPPVIDLTRTDFESAQLTGDADKQTQEFDRRVEKVRVIKQRLIAQRREQPVAYPVTRIENVIDTKTLIAVIEKAAKAIESGAWVPKEEDLPIGLGELPTIIQPDLNDIRNASYRYPLETNSVYKTHGIRI